MSTIQFDPEFKKQAIKHLVEKTYSETIKDWEKKHPGKNFIEEHKKSKLDRWFGKRLLRKILWWKIERAESIFSQKQDKEEIQTCIAEFVDDIWTTFE
ncbi:MAG: hypothetical protein WBC21_03870 [Minisyncoccales bacterium]